MAEIDTTPARTGANVPSKTKLTDRFIEALKPPQKGQRLVVWDSIESGLAVRVFDSGHKSFIVTKRIRGGAPKRITIKPAYPLTTLAAARAKAQAIKIELANGVDPIARQRTEDAERERKKAEEAARLSFAAVAELYIESEIIGDDEENPILRSGHDMAKAIRRDLLSCKWAKKPIVDVTKADVVSMIQAIKADPDRRRSEKGKRSTPAFKAFNYVRKILAWALKRDFGLENNVCDRIDINDKTMAGPKGEARERTLDDAEIRLFWRGCGRLGYPKGSALRMLFLSGLRLRECVHAERSEFTTIDGAEHLSGPVFIVPARRMKGRNGKARKHVVPVVPFMQDVLAEVPKFQGGAQYVFSMKAGRTPLAAFGTLKEEIDAAILDVLREDMGLPAGAEVPAEHRMAHWTFHDLRRTARSWLSRSGTGWEIAERCVAHKVGNSTSQTYDLYEFLAEKRDAFERFTALVQRILNPTDNVVPLRAAH